MRPKKAIEGRLTMWLKLLEKPSGLQRNHLKMIRKQARELMWVLGEGTKIEVSDDYREYLPELMKKFKNKEI